MPRRPAALREHTDCWRSVGLHPRSARAVCGVRCAESRIRAVTHINSSRGFTLAPERVAIIGSGIGGLATALALQAQGHELVLIERDSAPPVIAPEAAFDAWERPGVPQFRHAHIMLARLQTILRDQHPALLAQLLAAGLTLSTVEEVLPASHYRGIEPQSGDEDLRHLWGRRATFEYVVRRYLGELPRVQFMHETRVVGLVGTRDNGRLTVHGVEVVRGDEPRETIEADLVVDASGARGKTIEWLGALGAKVEVDSRASGFSYACRHYRLNDPASAPPRESGGGNFDFLGYATFYAEHGHYAVTFSCPEEETELGELVCRPEGFDALCAQVPTLRLWTTHSSARTKVLGAGRFENRWRRFRAGAGAGDGEGGFAGFFAVGDALLQTNPMYGRGCASAFVQATVLAEVLRDVAEPQERVRRYYQRSHELLNPYFELSVATDRMYRTRAKLRRGAKVSPGDAVINYAYERAWLPATYRYPLLAREFLRSVQMREVSSLPVRLLAMWLLIVGFVHSLTRRHQAPRQPQQPLEREEFLRRVSARVRRDVGAGSLAP